VPRPNIVLIVADNLGWGELGCYGGGTLRGAPTTRIDQLAKEGLLLQNFNVESDCVPTRSALMTGRHPIRTGCLQSVPPGLPQGLTRWEITLPEILSGQGYATAHYGKWHLGDTAGRYPSDRGFDTWYGIPRTTDESQFTSTIGFDPSAADIPHIMRGQRGEPSEAVKVYDLETRRGIDEELVEHSRSFIQRNHATGKPFFLYLPMVHLHFPTLPHRDFAGRTKAGDFADSMVEMDHRVGQIVDEIDRLGLSEDTLFIFCSDNGPEFRTPYRGTAGPWRGTYHTAMEGSLRVPFIARWPGKIKPGRISNEMVHVTDLFTTLSKVAQAPIPADRPIDGIDQGPFLFGEQGKSAREGFLFHIKNDLRGEVARLEAALLLGARGK
jgi:arylsulfatase A-like enzyme